MTIADYQKLINKQSSKRATPEHDEQVILFKWAKLMGDKHPELNLLMAIPNGAYYGGHWSVANKMKAEGVKKGVPDVFLPVPVFYKRGSLKHAGLWIEMKAGKNKTSPEQDEWIKVLEEQSYAVEVCYSGEDAIDVIAKYLNWAGE